MLNLYRIHGTRCAAHPPIAGNRVRSYKSDEDKPRWKKCDCPISASGVINRKFNRKNLDVSDWEEALNLSMALETSGSWDTDCIKLHQSIVAPVAEVETSGVLVETALADWLKEHESSVGTYRVYKQFKAEIQAYADSKGYRTIDRFSGADIRDFRNSWKIEGADGEFIPVRRSTSTKKLSWVKAFFEFCVSNEWLERNPARKVVAIGEKGDEQRVPFSDQELERMLDACENLYGKQLIKWDRDVHHCGAVYTVNNYQRKWTGEDLADFILISVYTGLRISDVVTFHIDRLGDDGVCRIRAKKNGQWVYTPLPPMLVERIRARAERIGPLIFGEHTSTDLNVQTDVWRRKLIRLWELCGPWEKHPTPHRFRHTFARILLSNGVSVPDVADLMGDTEEVVRKHYSAWVRERQERLTNIMHRMYKEMPLLPVLRTKNTGNVVHMRKKA